MEYPEEIYATLAGGLLTESQRSRAVAMWPRRHAYEVGYAKGLTEQAYPLAGYSNLTEAISAGEPIDWERLDGKRVKCVKPEVGTLSGKMDRDARYYTNEPGGWWSSGMDDSYTAAFAAAWHGKRGWTLWVEGEMPMRRKTADQLKLGTYFLGKPPEKAAKSLVYVGGWNIRDCKSIYYAPSMLKSDFPATEWEVIEEYGTFQKPEGK